MQELRIIPHISLGYHHFWSILSCQVAPWCLSNPRTSVSCSRWTFAFYSPFDQDQLQQQQAVGSDSFPFGSDPFWVLVSAVTIHARFKACFCSSSIYSLNKLAQSSLMQIRGSISLCTLKLFLCLYQPMQSYCYFPAQMGFHGSLQAAEINTWEHNPSKLSMCFTTYRE